MDITKVISDFNEKKLRFHTKIENDMFAEILDNYMTGKFISSATVGMVLFESILTTRLIRQTSYPKEYIASKENISEQFDLILKREEEVINGNDSKKQRGLLFDQITLELVDQKIFTDDEKQQLDIFYKKYRNPVLHGLSHRLYELVYNKKPITFLDSDLKSKDIYKIVSENVIKQILELHSNKKILKE